MLLLPYLEQDGIQRMGIYWGDHREQRFKLQSGEWRPLDGYRDTLEVSPFGATLTLHDQTRVEFEPTGLGIRPAYRLDRVVDTSGSAIDVSYDGLGRVASATDPAGRTLTLSYEPGGRLAQVRYAHGSWSRTWNLASVNKTLSRVTCPSVTTDTGVQSYSTAFEYDARGNVVKTTDAEGQTWLYGYEPSSPYRLAWQQWPGNTPAQRVLYSYVDSLRRAVADPLGVTTTFTYDSEGRLAAVQDHLGNLGTFAYGDPNYAWAPSAVAAPSGTTWQHDYDAQGNLLARTSPAGHRTDYSYDGFNKLLQTLEPLVTDAWGNPEAARRQTDLVYDGNHRLVEVRRLAQPPDTFHVWTFAYSGLGQMTQATDPLKRVTAYTYDALGNLTRVTSPAGRTHDWLYEDPDLTFGFTVPNAVIDGLGQRTELVRDEWGRLRRKDYPASPDERYAYDGLSRLVRTEDGFTSPTVYSYTPAGFLASQQRGAQLVQISRLPNGLRSAITESGVPQPRVLEFRYDARNLLATLVEGGASLGFAYDADGRLVRRFLPTGASATYAYVDGLLASVVHRDGAKTPFSSFSYTYQSNGQRGHVDELGGSVVRYGYDLLGRLVREQRTGAVPYDFQWTYDAAGDRLSQLENGQPTRYSHDPDGLLTELSGPMGVWTYAWDAAARLRQRTQPSAIDAFSYDDAGRLIHADHAERGFPMTPWRDYAYGALGGRLKRTAFDLFGQPESQASFFDLASTPLREETASFRGGGHSTFLPTFAGGLARWLDATTGQSMYPATDADGSVRAWSDDAGAVGSYAAVYNAFGQAVHDQGPHPPYAFNADGGTRNDGDFGWLVVRDRTLYSPLEQIVVGAAGERAPRYGAQINYAGDRLDIYFDPAYTVTPGGLASTMGGPSYEEVVQMHLAANRIGAILASIRDQLSSFAVPEGVRLHLDALVASQNAAIASLQATMIGKDFQIFPAGAYQGTIRQPKSMWNPGYWFNGTHYEFAY